MTKPGIYRHYKGNLYRVLSIARHTETHEYFVVYQQLYGDYAYWIRPQTMFEEVVIVDGVSMQRFTLTNEL